MNKSHETLEMARLLTAQAVLEQIIERYAAGEDDVTVEIGWNRDNEWFVHLSTVPRTVVESGSNLLDAHRRFVERMDFERRYRTGQ